MNMYVHELKAYGKSTFIWAASMCLLSVLMLSMFPSFAQDAEEFIQLLQSYPESVLQAVGIQLETIASLLGFYSYLFTYILLCGAIQAMNLGTSIVSKEVREKTADFLLAKPVSRSSVITAKLLAALSSLLFTNLIYWVVSGAMASFVAQTPEELDYQVFFLISFTLLLTQLLFLSIGLAASVAAAKIRSVLSVSLGTVFSFFILSLFISATGDEKLRYATPFQYFNSAYIMEHASYEASYLIASVIVMAASIAAGYLIYMKKDIQAG